MLVLVQRELTHLSACAEEPAAQHARQMHPYAGLLSIEKSPLRLVCLSSFVTAQ